MRGITEKLSVRPRGIPMVNIEGRKRELNVEGYVTVNGTLWAYVLNNRALEPQQFYYWDVGTKAWIDKTEPSSPGTRVPYRTILRLVEA